MMGRHRICAAAADAAKSQCVLVELIGEFDAVGGLKHWTGFNSLAHWLSWACCKHPDAQTIRPRWAGERFDLNACVQALFTIELPEQQTEDLDQQAA
jgi:hypothetical protein